MVGRPAGGSGVVSRPAAPPGGPGPFGRHDLPAFVLLLALFAAERLAIHALGVSPDPTAIAGLWQHLPLSELREDYWGALAGLRSQPPLWNGVLGAAARLCGGDLFCVASGFQWSFMGLTLLSAVMVRAGLGLAGARPWLAWGAAYLLALGPSAAFFELFPLYAHLTMALAAGIGLALATLARDGARLWPLAALYALTAALCLTWSLFHPAFLPLAALCAWLAGARRAVTRPAGLALLLVFGLAAGAPAIRNQADYGLFAGGTWGGMNLAQTVRGLSREDRARCEFSTAIKEIGAIHPGIGDKALHLPEAAWRSRACLDASVAAIREAPWSWLWGRAGAVEASHRLWPYEYAQYRPLGWERLPIPDAARAQDAGAWRQDMSAAVLGGWPTFAWYAAIALGAVGALASGRFGASHGLALALIVMIAAEQGMAHLFNGAEQARMRWTVEPLILMLAAMIVEAGLGGRRDGRSS
ncbi:MAG: hypothetical protein CML46_14145 [Rhodobacteraceae bacterium]|nr:hypothetical protein [Paracoccaceae bacterium]